MVTEHRRLLDRAGERGQLEGWIRAATTPQRVVWRSRIVLLALDGFSSGEIAARVGVSPPTVRLWLHRFAEHGAASLLHDEPGRGRHASISPDAALSQLRTAHLVDETGHVTNFRAAAELLHVCPSTIRRALRRLVRTA